MERISLPDGAWADIREDVRKAPRKFTKLIDEAETRMASLPYFDVIRKASLTKDVEAEATKLESLITPEDIIGMSPILSNLNEARILALVVNWSFEHLPVVLASLDELPGDVFDALAAEADKRTKAPETETLAALADPTQLPAVTSV
jgi:hypothetical protein